MLQSIRDILKASDDGIDFRVIFDGQSKERQIRLLSADEIGIAFMHLPNGRHIIMVPWQQVSNLNIEMPPPTK